MVLSVGLHCAFYGSGDATGQSVVAEYSYAFSRYFAFTPGVRVGMACYTGADHFDLIASFGANASLTFTPLPKLFDNLKLEGGILYHRIADANGNFITYTYPYNRYTFDTADYGVENLWGLIWSVKVDIVNNRKVILGLRADMLTSFWEGYYECDGLQGGVYLGVRF